ncbi:MAG: peptidylprolyl isomerase [Planctomycetota bacterium]
MTNGTSNSSQRLRIGCIFALALVTGGCETGNWGTPTVRDSYAQERESQETADPRVETTQSATQPGKPGRPIAIVNDVPIEQKAVIRELIETRGLPLLQQHILRELARQATARAGLSVESVDIDREYDLTLQAARFNGKDVEKLTPARRAQMIEEWTQSRGVTRTELAIAMERQAHLRKLAERGVKTNEAMLQQEYKRVHGDKVEVRHIQLAAPRVWPQLQQRLSQDEEFSVLVRDFSQNTLSREKNGLLPPFTADDPSVPPAMVKAAFSLKVGEVSNPVEAEGSYHVLKLERRIPADNAAFEDVRDELDHNLRARLAAGEMERLGTELLMRAKLGIEDPVLREQYTKRQKSGELTGPPLSR